MVETFLYPIVTFLIFLILVFLLYVLAGKLGPKFKEAKYKLKSYACGEESPGENKPQSYGLFHVAFFFTVLHVGALLIATAPQGVGALLGIILIGSMGITALALYVGSDKHV